MKNQKKSYRRCSKEISKGMKGSKEITIYSSTQEGHAKGTNLTFKDDPHAALYGYKHYIPNPV